MKWRDIDKKYVARLDELRQKNPYELLGVHESASMDEIKITYREKVRLYHPDKADSFMKEYNQEVLKLLNNAMEELEKRHSNTDGKDIRTK